jgi:hypothetical protein
MAQRTSMMLLIQIYAGHPGEAKPPSPAGDMERIWTIRGHRGGPDG